MNEKVAQHFEAAVDVIRRQVSDNPKTDLVGAAVELVKPSLAQDMCDQHEFEKLKVQRKDQA